MTHTSSLLSTERQAHLFKDRDIHIIQHIVKQEIATSIRFAFLSLIKPVKDRFLCHSQPACRTSIGEKYFCFQCFLWAQNSLKRKDKMHTKVLFYTKCSFWHSVLVCMIKIGTL